MLQRERVLKQYFTTLGTESRSHHTGMFVTEFGAAFEPFAVGFCVLLFKLFFFQPAADNQSE